MYAPSHFEETRLDVLHALIAAHPLGTLVTHGGAGLNADHIPFEIAAPSAEAPFGTLRAHVARANPLWRQAGAEALAVFQGPSAYVSPSLYAEKPVSGKVVPTYNYAVAHAHGVLRAIEDPRWILALVGRLTARHEAARAAPWSVSDAPAEYIDTLLKAIVGIEIPIGRLQGKWKLSQNRLPADQAAVAADSGGALAALMRAPVTR
ncbi:MAG: transcriptional regulator [Massilia sp.]|nr:transcriptional regulator [Massilia sp.]